jgi:hypothetical protein
VINLETNHRQGAGGEFAELLNRLRVVRKGEMLEEDVKTLQARIRKKGHADMKNASINIVCKRATVFTMNMKYLMTTEGEMITNKAVNYKGNQKEYKPLLHRSGDGTIADTGYMDVLRLKVGVRVMLIKNIRTEDSLTNGQVGVLTAVIKDKQGGVQQLMVNFDKEDAGRMTRRESPQLELKFPGVTMIKKVLNSYSLTGSSGSTANLIQFPIVLSHAVTVHKTQGMTVYSPNTANMDINSCFEAAQGYVALGRTQELSQVYLMNSLDPNMIFASPNALEEYANLNSRSINQHPVEWDKEPTSSTVKVAALNIARLGPHMEDLKADFNLMRADVIHLCETWVSPDEEPGDLLQLEGFTANFVSVGNGKGLVTYTRGNFKHKEDIIEPEYQATVVSSATLNSIHIYRSARGSSLDLVDSILELLEPDKATVISGDFNVCLKEEPKNVITTAFTEAGFKQLVTRPTHVGGRIIDHVYLRDPKKLLSGYDLTHHTPYYSDHDCLCLSLAMTVQVNISLKSPLSTQCTNVFLRTHELLTPLEREGERAGGRARERGGREGERRAGGRVGPPTRREGVLGAQ